MKPPNVLCLRNDILYFCGFTLFEDQNVSIQYSRDGAPVVISPAGVYPNAVCSFPLDGHTCTDDAVINFFQKNGSLNCAFIEVDNRYIQVPYISVELSADDFESYGFKPEASPTH